MIMSTTTDASVTIYVAGFASETATNINGTEADISRENNMSLAQQRANAGTAWVLQRAEELGVDISGRVQTINGGISNSGTGADQSITIGTTF